MNPVRFAPGRTTPVGQQFGNYRARQVLGHGAFAMVLLGEHVHLRTLAAIKVPRSSTRHLLRAEAHLAFQLVHPAIVRTLDYGLQAGRPYLMMEYAPAGTLSQFRGSALPPDLVVEYAEQIASGLDYLHARGIVHCDIKPSNLLLGREEQVLISDFGIAQYVGRGAARRGSLIMGTPAYMAPEQMRGIPCFASDQYALAMVLYELLVGKPPLGEMKTGVAQRSLPTESPLLHEHETPLSWAVEKVIRRALDKDPVQRYASAGQFARALRQATSASSSRSFVLTSSHQAPSVPPVVAPTSTGNLPRTERPARRWSACVALCGGALMATSFIWLLNLLHSSGWQIFAALFGLWLIFCLFAMALAKYRKTTLLGGCIAVLALLAGLMGHSILASIGTALLLLMPSLTIAVSLYVRQASHPARG